MIKLSLTQMRILRQLSDGKPKSIENGLNMARWPTLVSLWHRNLIRPEHKREYNRCWTMRFVITPAGKTEIEKRSYPNG